MTDNKTKWISVKDKLPTKDGYCFVKNDKGFMDAALCKWNNNCKVFNVKDSEMNLIYTLEVSHYQELEG